MKYLLIVVGILAGIGLLGAAFYFGTKQTTVRSVTPEAPVTQSPAPAPADPNVKIFTSADLKISFQYEEMQNGEQFVAKQTGNKVYVYQTKFPMDQGQYIEVFSKDKNDDLKTAIEKKFLKNYSKTECLATVGKNPVANQAVPATFVFAQVLVPTSENDNMETLDAKWQKCPSPYTATNGIAYFLMDTAHPETFAFFSIGQYAIDAGPSLPWQSTIKFL